MKPKILRVGTVAKDKNGRISLSGWHIDPTNSTQLSAWRVDQLLALTMAYPEGTDLSLASVED